MWYIYMRHYNISAVWFEAEARQRHASLPIIPSLFLFSLSAMSKRDSTRVRITKVKKRRGVGSRTITVLDSDEEEPLPTTTDEYARVTRTRVTTSGKAERVVTSSVPIFEVDAADICTPPEANTTVPVDTVVENLIPVVPAKRREKVNDSVSGQT
jgi:hypothetical protein